jgi:cytoskeleton protein RodZ
VLPTATAVAVLAVGGVIFGHAIAHGQAPHGAAVATPQAPSVPPVIAATPTTPAKPSPPSKPSKPTRPRHPAHHRASPAALSVTDLGPACYIQVTNSRGHLIVRTIMHGGQHLAFRHHGLEVVLGNAGGVKISINGHRPQRAGRSGQVRIFRVR